ncbi:MAG TPA: DNA glycosylase [Verrucomicrobiae bacterium]|nr:DNA glycosylase [Verrucomicrobiae bacterium]
MSKPQAALNEIVLPVRDYDLPATLSSGQAFRWKVEQGAWEGVVGEHWVQLRDGITARTAAPVTDWNWLRDYLQVDIDLDAILLSFPDDEPMRQSVFACRGLRLLRQDPWECLASFILSSTKQIVQIQQILSLLCERFGRPLIVPPGHVPVYSFPAAERLAACAEADLRGCKMGFRAPNLLATSKIIGAGELNLESLRMRTTAEARAELMQLPGVGRKIADCVLLFAYSFQDAFPVDVWVMKALRQLYFPKRRPNSRKLREFADTHFGANAGYAQQYLFHYMRTKRRLSA